MTERKQTAEAQTRPLHILSVAYPQMPVAAGSGGGAEQVLRILESGLVHAGCRSTVVAAAGSRVAGHLIETPPMHALLTDERRERARQQHRQEIARAAADLQIDLIHYHGLDFLSYRPHEGSVPELVTLHLPLDWYDPALFRQTALAMNCVSQSQARSALPSHLLPVITNGIELEQYSVSRESGNYLLWIGRVCPEKGLHTALAIASRLDMPLIAAGPVHPFPSHMEYFETRVCPLLNQERRYVGAMEAQTKSRLLSGARCVLIPSTAAETSSLVAMEAIASGTPVVAFRSGALPEIVEQGETGFIVDTEEEMAEAVADAASCSRGAIRARAEARFSATAMIDSYLTLYRKILAG